MHDHPLTVHVTNGLSGQVLSFTMCNHLTILDLKMAICDVAEYHVKYLQVIQGTQVQQDDTKLWRLALPVWPDSFEVGDLVTMPWWCNNMTLALTICAQSHSAKPQRSCAWCKAVATTMRHCAKCKAHYCSHDCQRLHWPIHKHVCDHQQFWKLLRLAY